MVEHILWVFVRKIEDSFAKITNCNLSVEIHETSILFGNLFANTQEFHFDQIEQNKFLV